MKIIESSIQVEFTAKEVRALAKLLGKMSKQVKMNEYLLSEKQAILISEIYQGLIEIAGENE